MFPADQSVEDRICLLALEGRLSRSDLVSLAERLRGLAARGVPRVVIDARGVEHWDYRGLPAVGAAARWARQEGTAVACITPSSYLRDIAAFAGVLEDLDFHDDLRLEQAPVPLSLPPVRHAVEDLPLRTATGS